jgi:uncharacterized protein YcbX
VSTVIALRRYPLKSARGEDLDAVDIDRSGLRGDRGWACIDVGDGTVGSAKHPRRWGALLAVGTRLGDDGLELQVDGRTVRAGTGDADAALSAYLGRPVRLTRDMPAHARLHRMLPEDAGMVPEWMRDARAGAELVTDVAGTTRLGRFVDFAAVHIVTSGALSLLGQRMGGAAAAAERFRPNLVVDAPLDPEPGAELRIGGALLRVVMPTPRCVIPGLAQGELAADRAVLATLAKHYRMPVADLGRAACFGVYADVVESGPVRRGELVLS